MTQTGDGDMVILHFGNEFKDAKRTGCPGPCPSCGAPELGYAAPTLSAIFCPRCGWNGMEAARYAWGGIRLRRGLVL